MIAGERPRGLRLLVTMRGSILGDIALPLAIVVAIAVIVTLTHGMLFGLKLQMDVAVFGMLGTVLAIILGFRTNASYDRYREGRMLWGEITAGIRSFARALEGQLDHAQFTHDSPERRLLCRLVGMAHLLRHSLRGSDPHEDIAAWVDGDLAHTAIHSRFPAARLLDACSHDLRELALAGRLSDFARITLQQNLAFLQQQINGCDRLQTTPIPFAYSLLVHRTISVYLMLLPFGVVDSCGAMTPVVSFMLAYTFFGLEAVGAQIEEPFGLLPNDLPLAALCRGIEIDLAPFLGHAAPPPLEAVNGILS